MSWVIVLAFGYLYGGVPWGWLAGRFFGVNILDYGSGGIGTANVQRTLGTGAALLVFVADASKGALPVLLARFLLDSPVAEVVACLVAIAGHNWSPYLRFQGGRGVATSFGGFLVMMPPIALIALAGALLTITLSRYFSLGSMGGAVLAFLLLLGWWLAGQQVPLAYLVYGFIALCLILFQHRGNMARLLAGTERKLGEPAAKRDPPKP